jgi:HK97 family phage portal protein
VALLDRLLGRPPALATRAGSWPVSQTPGELFNIRTSGAGVSVTEEDTLSLSAVFAAVNVLSRIAAALPLNVYRREGGKREVAETNPAQWLLHTEANPEMSAVVARRTVEFHRLLWGNGYMEVVWDGAGRAAALWPLEPWRCRPKRELQTKALYYSIDNDRRKLAPRDVLHFTLTSHDGIVGQSFVDYAFDSLGVSIASQQFAARYFGNGARPGVILQHDGTPDPKQRAEMKDGWQRAHEGPDKAHGTAVVWGGWKVSEHGGSMSPQDSQLIETRRFTNEEVARWLNVPPHILRDLSRSTNNNIEQQSIEFVQLSLGLSLVEIEQEYDRKLLSPPATYCKHNLAGLLRGDSKSRSEFYAKMWGSGFVTQNEVRECEDLNPIGPDGDTFFVPVNMQPLDRALNPAVPPAVDQPVGDPPGGDPGKNPEPDTVPVPPPGPTPEMRAALRGLVADTFARLLKKETNEGRRAAKKPGEFLAWADRFYAGFQATMADALGPIALTLDAAKAASVSPAVQAERYCTLSREMLLSVAGRMANKPAEFPDAAEQLFAEWESNRADREAAAILGA